MNFKPEKIKSSADNICQVCFKPTDTNYIGTMNRFILDPSTKIICKKCAKSACKKTGCYWEDYSQLSPP